MSKSIQATPEVNAITSPDHINDNLTTVYTQICTSYQNLEDFRTKVLSFLPLASGAGIFFLLNTNLASITAYLEAIGLVGATVTMGLYFYELRALQLSSSLRETGRNVEKLMGVLGQFNTWPSSSWHFINNSVGSSLIYSSIFAGWLFIAALPDPHHVAFVHALIAFIGVLVLSLLARDFAHRRNETANKGITLQFSALKPPQDA